MSDVNDLIEMTSGGVNLPPAPAVVKPAGNLPAPTLFDPKSQPEQAVQAVQQTATQALPSPSVSIAAPYVSGQPLGLALGLPPLDPSRPTTIQDAGRPTPLPNAPVAAPAPAPVAFTPPPVVNAPLSHEASANDLHAAIFGTATPQVPTGTILNPQVSPPGLPAQPTYVPPAPPPGLPGGLTPPWESPAAAQAFVQPAPISTPTHVEPEEDGEDFLLGHPDNNWNGHAEHDEEPESVDTIVAQVQHEVAPALPAQPVAVPALPQPTEWKVAPSGTANDDELVETQKLMIEVEAAIRGVHHHLGLALMTNPNAKDEGSLVHRAIYMAKWQPEQVIQLPPHDILAMATALSAHQAWVASMENEWKARYEILGPELERILWIKRDGYSGKTKTEQEIQAIKREPALRNMRKEYFIAKAMAKVLDGMGDRFAQLENALKRPADLRAMEMTRTYAGRDHVR